MHHDHTTWWFFWDIWAKYSFTAHVVADIKDTNTSLLCKISKHKSIRSKSLQIVLLKSNPEFHRMVSKIKTELVISIFKSCWTTLFTELWKFMISWNLGKVHLMRKILWYYQKLLEGLEKIVQIKCLSETSKDPIVSESMRQCIICRQVLIQLVCNLEWEGGLAVQAAL